MVPKSSRHHRPGPRVGGAANNLLDILRYKYVEDFVDLGWWPIFNFATSESSAA
jgi:hypothetical protein